jgi:hypothetical protein
LQEQGCKSETVAHNETKKRIIVAHAFKAGGKVVLKSARVIADKCDAALRPVHKFLIAFSHWPLRIGSDAPSL